MLVAFLFGALTYLMIFLIVKEVREGNCECPSGFKTFQTMRIDKKSITEIKSFCYPHSFEVVDGEYRLRGLKILKDSVIFKNPNNKVNSLPYQDFKRRYRKYNG